MKTMNTTFKILFFELRVTVHRLLLRHDVGAGAVRVTTGKPVVHLHSSKIKRHFPPCVTRKHDGQGLGHEGH